MFQAPRPMPVSINAFCWSILLFDVSENPVVRIASVLLLPGTPDRSFGIQPLGWCPWGRAPRGEYGLWQWMHVRSASTLASLGQSCNAN